nr:CBS domain-containing protein [Saccharopolyspora sp. HNM0983]
MAGLPVFGPDGEPIGRVRDVLAALSPRGRAPRVLGLVLEVAPRRRIFVPMLRVTRIDPTAVTLATGTVNLRRFHQRPNELLVLGQLLDAEVSVLDTGTRAVLVDIALEQTRSRDWQLHKVAVRERTGRLGRKGRTQVLDWDRVAAPAIAELESRPQGVRRLLAVFDTMRAVDVASALHELPVKRRREVAEGLGHDRLAEVVAELPVDDRTDLLAHLADDRAARVLESMDPDDAADLLAEMPEGDKERLLGLMAPEESAPVRRLLEYSADTAGGLMTPAPVVVTPDTTIAEALALARDRDVPIALASLVFVCRPPTATPTGRYLGCAHLQRLLREPPSTLVSGALDTDLASLPPDASLAAVSRYFAAYNLVCGPVLDDQEHLLGAITVDDLLDHLLPADWRESGLPDQERRDADEA